LHSESKLIRQNDRWELFTHENTRGSWLADPIKLWLFLPSLGLSKGPLGHCRAILRRGTVQMLGLREPTAVLPLTSKLGQAWRRGCDLWSKRREEGERPQ
jgi:hypothetical protein